MTVAEFLHMDGYAWFVWPSFLVAMIVLLGNAWAARAALRNAIVEAKRRVAGLADSQQADSQQAGSQQADSRPQGART